MSSCLSPRLRHTSGIDWLEQPRRRPSFSSISCKQTISHRSVTHEMQKWAAVTWYCKYRECMMGIQSASYFTDVYLITAHAAKELLPIFPLPCHLIQEKILLQDIFHTWSGIFPACWFWVGGDAALGYWWGGDGFLLWVRQRREKTSLG